MTTASEKFNPIDDLLSLLGDSETFLGITDVRTVTAFFTAKNSRRTELHIDENGNVEVLDYVVKESLTEREYRALKATDSADRLACAKILAINSFVDVFDYEKLVPVALQTAVRRATAHAKLDEIGLTVRMTSGENIVCTFGGGDLYAQHVSDANDHFLSKEEEDIFLDKHGARHVLPLFLIACFSIALDSFRWNEMQRTPNMPF